MEDYNVYCEPDPMNPQCSVWTFKGANKWYFTKEEAEKALYDKDMIESIRMWLDEVEPKWVEKEQKWLDELEDRLL